MTRFLALFLTPASVLEDWMNTDPEVREAADTKMKGEWDAWMKEHSSMVKEISGAGKTKRVTSDGVTDTKNDVMMFSIVEAESPEAAAAIFEGHPHLQIPQSTIEVMAANPVSMQ